MENSCHLPPTGFSRSEDAFQICITAIVTGLVTVAGSVGYHWFSVVFQFLGFLRLEENSLKLLEPKLKISCQHDLCSVLVFNDCFLLNYSQPCETIFNEPQPALTCTLPDLQSVGRRFAVGVLGARTNPRTPTSRADGERGAFNI